MARAPLATPYWVRPLLVIEAGLVLRSHYSCVTRCILRLCVKWCPVRADRKAFEAKRSASSVTGESKAVEGLVQGRHITVVDTPGARRCSARVSPGTSSSSHQVAEVLAMPWKPQSVTSRSFQTVLSCAQVS
jgi:hypothetical protein